MIAFISSFPVGAAALAMGAVFAGFWITVRGHDVLERRRHSRHIDPCRRCGARN